MKLLSYQQSNGDFHLLSPPLYVNLDSFIYALDFLKKWEDDKWFGISKDAIFLNLVDQLEVPTFPLFADKVITIFLKCFVYRPDGLIDKDSLTVQDLKGLIQVADRLLELTELPIIPEIKKEGENKPLPIQTTGDQVSDLIGDLISRFGANATVLYTSLDLDSLRQILNRDSQYSYWQNPEIQEQLEKEQSKESAKQMLDEAFAAKHNKTLVYLDENPEKSDNKLQPINFEEL